MEYLHSISFGRLNVTLSAQVLGRDAVLWLYGGNCPHVGAVAVGGTGEPIRLETFPGHREDVVARALSRRLAEWGRLEHTVVCCGIHVDQITPGEIQTVLALCYNLGEDFIRRVEEEEDVL